MKTINTGVKLDVDLHIRLKALSDIKERSPHWLMKKAIEDYVNKEEVFERENREDEDRWQNYKLTGHGISKERVDEWLNSWGTDNELPCPE